MELPGPSRTDRCGSNAVDLLRKQAKYTCLKNFGRPRSSSKHSASEEKMDNRLHTWAAEKLRQASDGEMCEIDEELEEGQIHEDNIQHCEGHLAAQVSGSKVTKFATMPL